MKKSRFKDALKNVFMQNNARKGEQGFTVVEFLVVLLGGALLIAGGAKMASMIFGTTKLASTEQALTAFRTNIQYTYTDVRSYNSITNDELIAAVAVPPTMLTADKTADECVKLGGFQSDTWESISVNGAEITRGSIVTTEQCTSETDNTITYTSH